MRCTVLLIALGTMLALACTQGSVETDHQVTMLMLPDGDPEAGREAFISLGCAACHAVAWADDLPAPVSAVVGPELGLDVPHGGPGRLATSIVAPSHRVSTKYAVKTESGASASPMTNFNSVMTIQQLSDIVAFLQRKGLETQSKTQPLR